MDVKELSNLVWSREPVAGKDPAETASPLFTVGWYCRICKREEFSELPGRYQGKVPFDVVTMLRTRADAHMRAHRVQAAQAKAKAARNG
nr:MAG TPA: hypothetical protein [Caudoviricetes sp.]